MLARLCSCHSTTASDNARVAFLLYLARTLLVDNLAAMPVPAAAAAVERDAAVRFAAVPGVLLPHMRLPPLERAELNVAGPCLWDGGPLLCPPDGLCFLYAWLAAFSPHEWHRVGKDAHGFINDLAEEALWKGRAKTLLHRCAALMEAEGESTMANRLKAGGYPGDEELAYYTRALGGAVLITPLEEAQSGFCSHPRARASPM